MITALAIAVVLGSVCIFLSLENDSLTKSSRELKKSEEDRIYKLTIIKDLEEKIAYETDSERIIDTIMASLRNIVDYSTASSAIIKDKRVILKTYTEENVGSEYIEKVETATLSSLEKFIGKLPSEADKKIYGVAIDDTAKAAYSSSCHMPLVANGEVLAIIHLSSTLQNAYSDIRDLHEFIDTASSILTRFRRAIDAKIERFSSLVANIPNGVLLTNSKNELLIINNSAKKLLGIKKDNDFSNVLDAIRPSFDLADKINRVILTKEPYAGQEMVEVNNMTLRFFINPIGDDRASVSIMNETSCRNKTLLKEDVINIMVHELRSPATTIKDSAELIITSEDTLGDEKKARFLEIIHQQAKKILVQVGSILDTAKLDAGKLTLQKTKGDISKLIKEEVQSFAPQAERKNISLSFNTLADSIPEISFDEIRISQVIDNLLSNGIKFTPEKGEIKVELDYKVLPPTTDGTSPMKDILSLDKFVVISVSDTGIGITSEQQHSLFSKYTQVENISEKISAKGTGLGLYLTKGIIETHGGRIWVKSSPGQGATFYFSLPTKDI